MMKSSNLWDSVKAFCRGKDIALKYAPQKNLTVYIGGLFCNTRNEEEYYQKGKYRCSDLLIKTHNSSIKYLQMNL